MGRQTARWLPVLAVTALLVVAWLAAGYSSPEISRLPVPELTQAGPGSGNAKITATAPPTEPTVDQQRSTTVLLPSWLVPVGGVLCGLVVLAVVALLVLPLFRSWADKRRRLLEKGPEEPERLEPAGDDVLAAVDAGLVELSDSDADPRRAVIACWVRLETAAAAAGTPREVGDSPTDLVRRLLSRHAISRAALDGLAAAYLEARYATHPVDSRTRQDAVNALRQLRAELAAPAYGAGHA